MSVWVIGDVHGCYEQLKSLYRSLDFDPDKDSLWLTGDLVNRGPDSARVLRWCRKREKQLGNRFRCVLGNHDLHALAVYFGVVRSRSRDTMADLLQVADRDRLFDWLLHRPFLVHRKGILLVHAGVLPGWTSDDARKIANKLQRKLLEDPPRFLSGRLTRSQREQLAALTRMRTLTKKARQASYSGSLRRVPKRLTPWFRFPGRRTADVPIYCGHWAALGLHRENNVTAIDTGCVWGGNLTAVRLKDGKTRQVPGLGR